MSRLKAPEWAIIYAGYKVFTSDDGSWIDAPASGVLAIVYQSPETGWSIAQGGPTKQGDYYVRLENNEVVPVGYDSVVDWMVNVFQAAHVFHIGLPTKFILNESGALVDKDGLILYALEKGLMKQGRMVTREEWAWATGMALAIMGALKKTGHFKWEEVLDGVS